MWSVLAPPPPPPGELLLHNHGWEREAVGILVLIQLLMTTYTALFFARALVLALTRGSAPMSSWVLLLGLLPELGLLFLLA
jgi:hypothetical protein